jgi:thiamine transport system permease protein
LGCALLGAARYFRLRLGRPGTGAAIEGSGAAVLVVPPFVLGAGWFVLLHGRIDVLAIGPIVVVAVNALMALPYVMRGLGPAIARADERHDRLCRSLGIGGWRRFRLIDWPGLRRPLALVFALAMALSVGDLGAIALFGTQDTATLPLLLYQRMGSYRIDEAAAIALVLGALSLGLFAAIERGFGGHERG